MDRREFFRTLGAAGLAVGTAAPARASSEAADYGDCRGVLVDLTKCIGCRKCEWACNTANGLPAQPLETFEDKSAFIDFRRPDAGHYTVVNEFSSAEHPKPVWAKVQCMHCNDPACASACLVTAFTKQENGAVVYDAWRCMGCRYCMVACPFQIPTYEFDNALNPQVRKCTLCAHRLADGGVPACVEICPPQCLTFGARKDLLALGHNKISAQPELYVDHVYGEHEVGGTSWLYISDRPFAEMALPALPSAPPPRFTEKLQHGIFKGFVPPLGLYAVLGGITWLFRRKPEEDGSPADGNPGHGKPGPAAEAAHEEAAPVKHPLVTPGTIGLLLVALVGLGFALARFLTGIGPVTNMNDQYPWGIWIGIDVATGVALSAGGFTVAALAHIFHREHYHPIVRPALLSALLGYTFAVLGLLCDLGRYYNVWHPMLPSMWSGQSVLFEVGMCVMIYLTVLYFEFVPIVTERLRGNVRLPGFLRALEAPAERLVDLMDRSFRRVMMALILAGVVLSCLHQSSLGSLMLLAPTKMNALWYTPILPLLFLVSAIGVGYAVVLFESFASARAFRREPEMHLLPGLGRIIPVILSIYFVLKLGDLVVRDALPLVFAGGLASWMFVIELGVGVVLPFALLMSERVRRSPGGLFLAAVLVIVGVLINRINVFLVAYRPLYPEGSYFPSVGEVAVTAGLFATLALVYRVMVTIFPVLPATGHSRG
jgi:Ni/Fe-hydrogenase subunit HybB-like protein/Fe-S-cluster-containing dehydrogenase component